MMDRLNGPIEQWEFYILQSRCVAALVPDAPRATWHVYAEVPVLVGVAQPELVSWRSDRFPEFVTARQCREGHEVFGITAYLPLGERKFEDIDGALMAARSLVIGPVLGFPSHDVENGYAK